MKAVKGDRVPYDTAVIINLPTYRLETAKLKAGEHLINNQRIEIDSLHQQILIKDRIQTAHNTAINYLTESAKRNEESFNQLNGKFDKLYAEATKEKKWHEKPFTLIIVFIVGSTIGLLAH